MYNYLHAKKRTFKHIQNHIIAFLHFKIYRTCPKLPNVDSAGKELRTRRRGD